MMIEKRDLSAVRSGKSCKTISSKGTPAQHNTWTYWAVGHFTNDIYNIEKSIDATNNIHTIKLLFFGEENII